jgi:hypothetical protein
MAQKLIEQRKSLLKRKILLNGTAQKLIEAQKLLKHKNF